MIVMLSSRDLKYRDSLDLQHDVAGQHARLQGGRVVHGRDDGQEAVDLIDFSADSHVRAAHLLIEVALLRWGHVHGVRIVERADHRPNHRPLHRLVVRLVHESLNDQVAHIDDRIEPLVRGTAIGDRQRKLHKQYAEQRDHQNGAEGFLDPHE